MPLMPPQRCRRPPKRRRGERRPDSTKAIPKAPEAGGATPPAPAAPGMPKSPEPPRTGAQWHPPAAAGATATPATRKSPSAYSIVLVSHL